MADRPLIIRRARPDDLDIVLEMVREYCAEDRHPFDVEVARSGLAPLLESDDHGVVWMIEPDDLTLGYAVMTWGWSVESGGRDVLMDEIYLRERGRGYGTQAISEIIANLRERGIRRAFMETEAHNEAARRLYQRLGFEIESSIWMSRSL